jgi:hypothetical protein
MSQNVTYLETSLISVAYIQTLQTLDVKGN